MLLFSCAAVNGAGLKGVNGPYFFVPSHVPSHGSTFYKKVRHERSLSCVPFSSACHFPFSSFLAQPGSSFYVYAEGKTWSLAKIVTLGPDRAEGQVYYTCTTPTAEKVPPSSGWVTKAETAGCAPSAVKVIDAV